MLNARSDKNFDFDFIARAAQVQKIEWTGTAWTLGPAAGEMPPLAFEALREYVKRLNAAGLTPSKLLAALKAERVTAKARAGLRG